MLDTEYVTDRIVEGILTEQQRLFIPKIIFAASVLKTYEIYLHIIDYVFLLSF